jgi:hypothetical protein
MPVRFNRFLKANTSGYNISISQFEKQKSGNLFYSVNLQYFIKHNKSNKIFKLCSVEKIKD